MIATWRCDELRWCLVSMLTFDDWYAAWPPLLLNLNGMILLCWHVDNEFWFVDSMMRWYFYDFWCDVETLLWFCYVVEMHIMTHSRMWDFDATLWHCVGMHMFETCHMMYWLEIGWLFGYAFLMACEACLNWD